MLTKRVVDEWMSLSRGHAAAADTVESFKRRSNRFMDEDGRKLVNKPFKKQQVRTV